MKLGRGIGVARTSNNSLVEVGPLSFQVCSGRLVEQGTDSTGLTKAKAQCMFELQIVENMESSPLVSIIEAILSLDGSYSFRVGQNMDERSLLVNMLVVLYRHEIAVEGAFYVFESRKFTRIAKESNTSLQNTAVREVRGVAQNEVQRQGGFKISADPVEGQLATPLNMEVQHDIPNTIKSVRA